MAAHGHWLDGILFDERSEAPVTTQASPPPFNGVNYVADIYGSYAAASSLGSLAPAGVNAVALTADFGIDAENSTVYQPGERGGDANWHPPR
jgi:hypothetical protein